VSLALLISVALSAQTPARNADAIRPWSENPCYWQYEGRPVLLLGGSKTDHIFLLDDLEPHLDEIARAGGNYVRNTMSQREGQDLKPHARLPDGRFDLERWNETYWTRFANCLKWCAKRRIIVQIEVWDRFDFSQEHWRDSPWRPRNNINYGERESGLADAYPVPPWRDRQPFFHTIEGMPRYRKELDLVRGYQERFVAKMLSYSLRHGNVLYCMNNETSTPPRWGLYWMAFIEKAAAAHGVDVFVTDMFDDGWKPERSPKLRQAFDRPGRYEFIEISQINCRNFDQAQWDRLAWVVGQLKAHPRPLNHTKIYSDGETKWGSGTPKDGLERFWRNLIAGSASCRFHRPTGGIGLDHRAKACIGAARKVESLVRFWDVEPRMELLANRDTDEAYLAARPGVAYVLYFTDGGAVDLDLAAHGGTFRLRWVDVQRGAWGAESDVEGGRRATIAAPGPGGHVAVLRAAGD